MTADRYAEIYAAHRWEVPARFNIAHACCGRWAPDRSRFALYWEDESGATAAFTFWDLQQQANRLSNALIALGIEPGDKIALILPQRPETVVAHIAAYQVGAVAVPLSFLFGPEALSYRLNDSGARVAFVDAVGNERPHRHSEKRHPEHPAQPGSVDQGPEQHPHRPRGGMIGERCQQDAAHYRQRPAEPRRQQQRQELRLVAELGEGDDGGRNQESVHGRPSADRAAITLARLRRPIRVPKTMPKVSPIPFGTVRAMTRGSSLLT